MAQRALIPILAGLVFALAFPSDAAEALQRPVSALAGVAGLEKPVTYTEIKIPLGELVEKVAAETGVALTAARGTADTPVAVVVKELPARILLEQLAEVLDYRWARRSGVQASGRSSAPNRPGSPPSTPGGSAGPERPNARTPERLARYEIWQDVAAKQREEALRQASLTAMERRLAAEVRRVAEIAALPQEQIQRLLEESERRRREIAQLPPEIQQARARSAVEQERWQHYAAAGRLASPVTRALGVLLGRLSAEHWATLRAGQTLTFATTPGPVELPMPTEVARLFRAARPTLLPPGARPEFGDPAEEAELRRQEQARQARWAAAPGYRATLHLEGSRLATAGPLMLQAHAEMPSPDAGPAVSFRSSMHERVASLIVTATRFDWQAEILAEETPERRVRMAKDPVLGVPKRFRLETKPRPAPYAPTGAVVWGVKELLPDIARVYGVNIISDRYFNTAGGQFSPATLPAEPVALGELLDRVVHYGQQWELAGAGEPAGSGPPCVVRLRSRTWFLDRPKELPLRLVERWQTLVAQQGVLPLEEYVQMASTLNDGQLDIVAALVRVGALPPYTSGFSDLSAGRNALRLYGTMTPTQRQALAGGATITPEQMTPAQRKLYLTLLRARDNRRADVSEPAAGTVAGLSLTGMPLVLTIEHGTRGLTTRMDPVNGPGAAAEPPAAAAEVPAAGATAVAPPARVERHPVTQLQLRLQYGPHSQDTVALMVARPG